MLTEERIIELAWVARSAGPDVMAMVQESIRQAAIETAEACAKVCDEAQPPLEYFDVTRAAGGMARHCAKAIRMRSNAQ